MYGDTRFTSNNIVQYICAVFYIHGQDLSSTSGQAELVMQKNPHYDNIKRDFLAQIRPILEDILVEVGKGERGRLLASGYTVLTYTRPIFTASYIQHTIHPEMPSLLYLQDIFTLH